jgi:signal transduction histidine kinase
LLKRVEKNIIMNQNAPLKRHGLRFKIFPKLFLSFLILSLVPLIILGYGASRNMSETGSESIIISRQMGERNLQSATQIGHAAIQDSVQQLDDKASEAIETRTMDLAQRIADFLYERDADILALAAFAPDAKAYLQVYRSSRRDVIVAPGPPRAPGHSEKPELISDNPENKTAWRHRPPDDFAKSARPVYKEITFVGLDGRERIKISDGRISAELKDIRQRENTFCRAEDYFDHLPALGKGDIYVSRVIGPYQKGWLYKTADGTIAVKPQSAYSGKENPQGQPFQGIIRWATPVFRGHRKIGYLTMALDHRHIMEFTDHVVPTEERFTAIPDASSGNYAFLWDVQDKCISHPRDFFISGYDPQTGRPVPGWLSQQAYAQYQQSGLSLPEFMQGLPSFKNFTQKKSGSLEQLKEGSIGLDCRILDTAPQCQGWHQGTEDGGSGSFLILWSGLWKLTTYATVPYYTGQYGASKRGFGYVTIGAQVDDFHKAANITRATIEKSIAEQAEDIQRTNIKAGDLIAKSTARNRRFLLTITLASVLGVIGAAIYLSLNFIKPLKRLTDGAQAMGRGELNQHIEVTTGDEIGQLADSFNKMVCTVAEVDRMKSDFVTIASHELRTPIHAMLLGVSGLLGGYAGDLSSEIKEDLLIVNEGITRLRNLVESLLDLSRIEARKIELHLSPESLHRLVVHAVEELGKLIAAYHHDVRLDVPQDLPALMVDGKRISQAIINLLSNAVKYTPPGGQIQIRAERDGHHVHLAIADNGFGIPQWAQHRIFEKFFQADSIMSQKVGGSGLGLAISKGIIEEHGGLIEFKSPLPADQFPDIQLDAERHGTVFFMCLPLDSTKACRQRESSTRACGPDADCPPV